MSEDYLAELKRFAAALNGVVDTPPRARAPSLPARRRTFRPVPVVDLPDQLHAEDEWWRVLDERLAKAPRRPRFGPRKLSDGPPMVTRTAAPMPAVPPPPQLRRRIDEPFAGSTGLAGRHRTKWDKLDAFLGVAGLLVVALGTISSSAPVGIGEGADRRPAVIALSEVSEPVRAAGSGDPVEPLSPAGQSLLPAPPPFPVTAALFSEGWTRRGLDPFGVSSVQLAALPELLVETKSEPTEQPDVSALIDAAKASAIPNGERLEPDTGSLAADRQADPIPRVSSLDSPKSLPAAAAIRRPLSEPVQIEIAAQPGDPDLKAAPAAVAVQRPLAEPTQTEVVAGPTDPNPSLAKAPSPAEVVSGRWLAHLASVREEGGAAGEWVRLQRLYPEPLGELSPSVRRVDLPKKGTWFRIFAGPFESRQDAAAMCARLGSQYCQPMENRRVTGG